MGFWEPIALTDVTREPFCMVNLGGLQLPFGAAWRRGNVESASADDNNSFYEVHWYKYPLLYWLQLITDSLCMETGDWDVAFLTELDPTWHDDELNFIFNPEAILFGNVITQAACAAQSLAATTGLPIDQLFWCAGAQGSMFPFTGHVQEHIGGVQASTLLTERLAAKLHRLSFLHVSDGSSVSKICDKHTALTIPQSQYRYQMVNPVPTVGTGGCHPFGHSTATWGAGHEIPYKGEDFGYLVWRKNNCCAG